VLDVRWSLTGLVGREAYDVGHVPGAIFVDLDRQLCGPPGTAGRHPLPDPAALEQVLRQAGIHHDDWVVIYDAGDGAAAARAWWTLRWAGLTSVSVLDGGYAAWVASGGDVTQQVPSPEPGDVTVRPGGMPVLDAADAAALAGSGILLDARTPQRYSGQMEPIDPVAGHIPGAVNLPMGELVDADGRLLPADQLRECFARVGVREGTRVGAYCGSGVTAAHTVLASVAAGLEPAALYVGSWSEWVADPRRPIATGSGEQTTETSSQEDS